LGGLATDESGNIYVADGDTVRKVTSEGLVTTLAGQHYDPYYQGVFTNFSGVAGDGVGNLLVTDWYNKNAIFRITSDGAVSVWAGQPGVPGNTDATGSGARFTSALLLTSDLSGNVYVADDNAIRKVTLDGTVTTVAGIPGVSGSADGTGTAASFKDPQGAAVDLLGNLYISDTGNYTIRKMTPDRVVTTLAGLAGRQGTSNGTGTVARFSGPQGIGVDSLGNLYVADGCALRRVTPQAAVTTLAGQPGACGSADGIGSAARFQGPGGVTVDALDTIYVLDGQTVRRVTPEGLVTTIAGYTPFNPDYYGAYVDGPGNLARFGVSFWANHGFFLDSSGNIYLNDQLTSIRKGIPSLSLPAVTLRPFSSQSGQISCWISGLPGSTVAIESSADLANWRLVGMYRLAGGTNLFISPTPMQGTQFYRARL
jgi:hypothetical protein